MNTSRGSKSAARRATRFETNRGQLLRAGAGFDLAAVDPAATPGFTGGKDAGIRALRAHDKKLAGLQELLFANGVSGDRRRVLLVLQAMDTAGKGGIVRHVIGSVDPQGVHLASFKAPTDAEKRHDFLWRIRQQVPPPGKIGVFDRSHYEDVLIVRVRELAPPEVIEERYGQIVDFERELVADGITVIKVMLHVSYEEQGRRLEARLDRPEKHWKFHPSDVDERELWPLYQVAYQLAITRTSTDSAPWYVIPADHKWYARLAVQHLLIDALASLDQHWPLADFDVEAERARLRATAHLAG
jgi:PPK2 family polyphosphate:nucleotide phosphotransferase